VLTIIGSGTRRNVGTQAIVDTSAHVQRIPFRPIEYGKRQVVTDRGLSSHVVYGSHIRPLYNTSRVWTTDPLASTPDPVSSFNELWELSTDSSLESGVFVLRPPPGFIPGLGDSSWLLPDERVLQHVRSEGESPHREDFDDVSDGQSWSERMEEG
jgi:hypothetical protein